MNAGEGSSPQEWLETAKGVLEAEADALRSAASRLDGNLIKAVELILAHKGKVVVTGMGKSGHVARKVSATLCSTGTPAVFLHAAEAAHGDLGIYTPGDPTIMISKSGATAELVELIPVLRQFQSPLIGIVGNLSCPLVEKVDIVLDARVAREADPLNLAPTCSTTVALGVGDALAVALMRGRRFSDLDFARYHPSGQLGRNLLLRVSDVMHVGKEVAWVAPHDALRTVVIAMTQRPLGAALVVDQQGMLCGIITDGDLRRALQAYEDIRLLHAREVMTPNPITVAPEVLLKDAVQVMEDRPSQISVLPVVEGGTRCVGLLRIHDVYQAGLA